MMMIRPKKINQTDIARLAEVSVSTVSRALGGASGISPQVSSRIRRIANELGYSEKASPAATSASAIVYLPMHPVTRGLHQIFHDMLEGVQQEAADTDLVLFPKLLPEEDVDLALVTALAREHDTDAALMFYMDPGPEVAAFFQTSRSLVLVNNIDTAMRFDSIIPDNYEGSRLATHALIAQGHRSILYVVGNMRYSPRERVRGFNDAVAEAENIRSDVISLGYDRQETAYSYFSRYFAEGQPRDWTAMMCANDLMALGVLQAARENGFSIPDDFSIIGFDDLNWSRMTTPRLSTVNVDRQAMGREAVRLLKRRQDEPDAPVMKYVQGVSYVAGGTIADIRGASGGKKKTTSI